MTERERLKGLQAEYKQEAQKLVERFFKADEVNKPTGLMERELAKECAILHCRIAIENANWYAEMKLLINWGKTCEYQLNLIKEIEKL